MLDSVIYNTQRNLKKGDAMHIKTERIMSLLGPNLAKKLFEFKLRQAALNAGYSNVTDWHPSVPADWGEFPKIPFETSEVYHGSLEENAYNHHHAICKFKNRYVASWSTAPIDEDKPGQEVHFAVSDDLKVWSGNKPVITTDPSTGTIRNNAGMCVHEGKLYDFVGVVEGAKESEDPSLTSFVPDSVRLDVYVTKDMVSWQEHTGIADDVYLFEGPRNLDNGAFLCCGRSFFGRTQPVALLWDPGLDPAQPPKRIPIPETDRRIQGLQGTWYQLDDGTVCMMLRDAGMSARFALSQSTDRGKSWSDVLLTDMPNTCSRAHAGRFTDGRYYVIGNNYDNLLDRRYLLIAISDDGRVFDSMYTLVSGETHRRIDGLHKEDGWHYPNSIVDGNRIIVIFSVNKEDIYCGTADASVLT